MLDCPCSKRICMRSLGLTSEREAKATCQRLDEGDESVIAPRDIGRSLDSG
jgi:hypothetical protein